nr:BspA family leucine-rich repeat surface protein [Ruegeria arenilitoris]
MAWEYYDLSSTPDTSGWDTSHVVSTNNTFRNNFNFNQDIGGWDISAVTNMVAMLNSSGISIANMDATIKGLAQLDYTSGETAIKSGVAFGVAKYTDATAVQYLTDTYGWTISESFDTATAEKGTNTGETINATQLRPSFMHLAAMILSSAPQETIISTAALATIR